jgi:endonuclease YncB( thermonuclease family)
MNRTFQNHPLPFPAREWRGYVVRVVDGDTVWAEIDRGWDDGSVRSLRVKGYDAPEIFHPTSPEERRRGLEAKAALEALVLDQPVRLTTERLSFERYVGRLEVWREGAWLDVAAEMIRQGFTKTAAETKGAER